MLLKFAFVGLTGVGINMGVYIPATALFGNYLVAATCSFSVAVTSNFIGNLFWTFKERATEKSIPRKYLSFFTISVMNLGLNLAILQIVVEYFKVNETIAQLCAIGLVSVCNFTLNYLITFGGSEKKRKQEVNVTYETGYHTNL
ncbi:MAG: GtrA family protein [Negativicutes bacterium]